MEHITLNRTGLRVSRVCLGTMTFGSQADGQVSTRILDCALDAGVNFIDTANVYSKGGSESILGAALKGRRDKVVLASKAGIAMGPGPDESGLSRAALRKAIDDSLRRLQTDYVDIYYLHQPDYKVPIEETLEVMEELVRAGKVRFPGTSNYSSWQVCEMLWLAEKNGYTAAVVAQPMYNLVARGLEQEFLPMARRLGVATVVYNPLAGGLLTGKHAGRTPAAGSRFVDNRIYRDRYWHPAFFDAVDRMVEIARQAERSTISLALNWLLEHTSIDCLVLGATGAEQLQQSLKAMEEGPLPEETLRACDQVWAQLRGVTPQYNR